MDQTVLIVDYGSGNIRSVQKALEQAAVDAGVPAKIVVSADPARLARADRIVLPGVGAFADCRAGLYGIGGLVETLNERVVAHRTPFLGICVGMQLMATTGHEKGVHQGLDWIRGTVTALKPKDKSLKIPHMGWNILNPVRPHPVLDGLRLGPDGLHAYFVHSFRFETKNTADLVAVTDYGGPVTACIARNNMFGTQFHPEKSQKLGLGLLANFLRWSP
ncbi:MAG: imidazole glycerol phosphate synthase subunit HisH [Alphaproteobacteria bacterium]|nr:imidazole glycerol phosphate synthase subunit HisH [Alphaproteobacteria bacterium]